MEKIAFFDFNGTLTKQNNSFDFLVGNKKFGFKRFIYKYLGFIPFVRKIGLRILGNKYKKQKISEVFIKNNALKIELKEDVFLTLNTLKNLGYKIVIISGGFKEIIEKALKENLFLVDEIFANNLVFNQGIVEKINVNPHDFGGKRKTILKYVKSENANIQKCIFTCNSFNDISALKLPLKKFYIGDTKVKKSIKIDSLSEILKLIN